MFHWSAPQAIWDASLLLAAALVARRGEWEERTVTLVMVIYTVAVTALQHAQDPGDKLLGGLVLAIICLTALVWAALRSGKWWPLWTAAFQLVGVAVFLAHMADPRIGALALAIWSYLILVVVVIATLARPGRAVAPSPSPGRSAMHSHS